MSGQEAIWDEFSAAQLETASSGGTERLTDNLTNCYENREEGNSWLVKRLHQSPANRRKIEEVTNLILIIELSM